MEHFVTMKVGRDAPCECGSGRKYKNCCLNRKTSNDSPAKAAAPSQETLGPPVLQTLRQAHVDLWGQVREPVHAELSGQRFVAVGSKLIVSRPSRPWRTFHDFLFGYARTCLGKEWADSERQKPEAQRHPLYRMHEGLVRGLQTENAAVSASEVSTTTATGDMAGFLSFAYDLFVVADNVHLQTNLLRRLRKSGMYQGARHELFAAATMARAGFKIDYEDEGDGSRKHPEFIAIHKQTNARVAVEAKSRHRPGVLGQPGTVEPSSAMKMRHLFLQALAKRPAMPFLIFLDLNLPLPDPSQPTTVVPFWIDDWEATLRSIRPEDHRYYTLVICSNFPFHYGAPHQPALARSASCHRSPIAEYAVSPEVLDDLARATNMAAKGVVPHEFPRQRLIRDERLAPGVLGVRFGDRL